MIRYTFDRSAIIKALDLSPATAALFSNADLVNALREHEAESVVESEADDS